MAVFIQPFDDDTFCLCYQLIDPDDQIYIVPPTAAALAING